MLDALVIILEALIIVIILITPLCQLSMGKWIAIGLSRIIGAAQEEVLDDSIQFAASNFMLGLLYHLLACFFLKCIGVPWLVAFGLPLTPLLFLLLQRKPFIGQVSVPANLNFVIWFFVTCAIGLSLFDTTDGIKTPWKNNYGDFTFHAGMISSWVLGQNFPPEYHIFPGQSLSYPVLVNIWTASQWWMSPSYFNLSFLFLLQWVILWAVVFFVLRGEKYWLLPWALLLGGGSYFALGENSGELISQQAPWAVFLTTIWVTQRTALLGMASLLSALWAFHRSFDHKLSTTGKRYFIALACSILALSPLAHTHITLVGVLYIAGVLILRFLVLAFVAMFSRLRESKLDDNLAWKESFGDGIQAIIFLVPSIHAWPWIRGKSGMMKSMYGWLTATPPAESGILDQLRLSLDMWYHNAGNWFVVFILLWAITRRHLFFLSIVFVFTLGNLVQLAEWNWDQIKIFIALYAVFFALWSQFKRTDAWLAHFLCIFLIFPGGYECWKIFKAGSLHTIYSKEDVKRAKEIRDYLGPNEIIASAPRHNSLVTLTGRKLFYGYEGTLSSHGILYFPRREIMLSLSKLAKCGTLQSAKHCPRYILWTEEEERYWKRKKPGKAFKKTELSYLYRIR